MATSRREKDGASGRSARLKTIPGNKHVCLEEGTQSAWLYEILSPHATEVVVTMVPESRGQKDDQRDAFAVSREFSCSSLG